MKIDNDDFLLGLFSPFLLALFFILAVVLIVWYTLWKLLRCFNYIRVPFCWLWTEVVDPFGNWAVRKVDKYVEWCKR